MLDQANGMNCQASNFLRTFRQFPQGFFFILLTDVASGLGLTETPADDQISLVRLLENFNRFILEQLHKESISNKHIQFSNDSPSTPLPSPLIIDELFGSTTISKSKCLSCKYETVRESRTFQYDMIYPESSMSSSSTPGVSTVPPDSNQSFSGDATFSNILRSSIFRTTHTKAWCEKCGRYQLTEQKRMLSSLPNVLCVNAAASKADFDFWKNIQGEF